MSSLNVPNNRRLRYVPSVNISETPFLVDGNVKTKWQGSTTYWSQTDQNDNNIIDRTPTRKYRGPQSRILSNQITMRELKATEKRLTQFDCWNMDDLDESRKGINVPASMASNNESPIVSSVLKQDTQSFLIKVIIKFNAMMNRQMATMLEDHSYVGSVFRLDVSLGSVLNWKCS